MKQLSQDTIWAIAKDQNGLIWLGSNAGLFRYDGYHVNSINDIIPTASITGVRSIKSDHHGVLWVGTRTRGLFKIKNNRVTHFEAKKEPNNYNLLSILTLLVEKKGVWFGSQNSLNFIDTENRISSFSLPENSSVTKKETLTSIVAISEQELLITTPHKVYTFNKVSHNFKKQNIAALGESYINRAYIDDEQRIWLVTNRGIFLKNSDDEAFLQYRQKSINYGVNDIVINHKNIWLGTTLHGLVKISKTDPTIVSYKTNPKDNSSISGNSIMYMMLDDSGVLYASSFHGGVSYFDTNTLNFGFISNTDNGVYCASTSVFYNIDVDEKENLWIAAESGLIEYNPMTSKCINYNHNTHNQEIFSNSYPIFSFVDSERSRWIATTRGLNRLDSQSGLIDESYRQNFNHSIVNIYELSQKKLLLGTNNGLYLYSHNNFTKIESKQTKLSHARIASIKKANNNQLYIATSEGIAMLDQNHNFQIIDNIQSQLPTNDIISIYINDNQDLWVGTNNYGLFKFNRNGKLVNSYNNMTQAISNLSIFSIISDHEYLWMGTNKGLIQLKIESDQYHLFHKSDGLQSDFFTANSAFKSPSGKLYFGGRNGLNAFDPKDIKLNTTPPNIVLTQMTRFGKTVQPNIENDGFVIDKPINDLEELVLTHTDYVVGFEFAALSLADPKRNKYAFKMEGLDPDWNHVNAENRKISYSNLKPGDYIFRVKGTNKDGVWNETGKSLHISVLPAPWLTWWAYSLYVLSFIALLFTYLYYKNKANAEITKRLRIEVDRQTKELQIQKNKVESLLERKNELFANVSHEFRTPLTLILGPINKMLGSSQHRDDMQSLQMINRNANRLLTMIEQLLQLAKMNDHDEITLIPQQVHTNLETLVASFQPSAEIKNITLTIIQNDEAAISGTQDIIDIVFGNLISNAIKYTQHGGKVIIKSHKQGDFINIDVSDNGCGLDEKQQVEIFNRFTRLDSHLDIAGVGIGLSVVEEMLKVNHGSIKVNSELGNGSTFSVRFNCIDFLTDKKHTESNQALLEQLVKESYMEEAASQHVQNYGNKKNETVLIIDDSSDMRTYVAETLKHQYYCITADRGKTGIAEAIKRVPDIIICDVMMPEMDGFQVSRILRSDTRTSHIPLILLTALNDKKNRIKGWRENIDVYLTKPFDAQELLIQLENILVIRNILKKKAGASIKSGKISMNSGLPHNDQVFVDKFIQLIKKMYTDPNFLRPQMASMMAVSDRQLQRKMKALIDENPLDILREYRLKKAVISLKDGNQVSITADKCGFNSVTYFSKCFKKKYGMSPKVYQQTCNKNTN